MPFFRIGSLLIDIAVAGIPCVGLFPDQSYNHQAVLFPIVFFAIDLFTIVVIFTGISGKGSLGDFLLKLKTVDAITGSIVSKSKLVLRSFCYWFAISGIPLAFYDPNRFPFFMALFILGSGYFIMFSNHNKYKKLYDFTRCAV